MGKISDILQLICGEKTFSRIRFACLISNKQFITQDLAYVLSSLEGKSYKAYNDILGKMPYNLDWMSFPDETIHMCQICILVREQNNSVGAGVDTFMKGNEAVSLKHLFHLFEFILKCINYG